MDKIEKFLLRYNKDTTKKTYKMTLNRFFKEIKKDPNTYFDDPINMEVIEEDIIKFIDKLPIKSKRDYFLRVKKFLNYNDVELKQSFFDDMKLKVGRKTIYGEDKIPTKEELDKILSLGGIKEKALFLTLVSSGIRIGELLKIPKEDLHLEETPCRILIRPDYSKNGLRRNTFVSEECKEWLILWVENERDKYLKMTIEKCKKIKQAYGKKKENDNRLFPLSYNTVMVIWGNLLRKTNLDKKDPVINHYLRHIHTLRKYFRTKLGSVNVDMTEHLMGHSGYLTRSYRQYALDELREFYQKGESILTIHGKSPYNGERIKQLEEELGKVKDELKPYQEFQQLTMKINELERLEREEVERIGLDKTSTKLRRIEAELKKCRKKLFTYDILDELIFE
jgi:integrase